MGFKLMNVGSGTCAEIEERKGRQEPSEEVLGALGHK